MFLTEIVLITIELRISDYLLREKEYPYLSHRNELGEVKEPNSGGINVTVQYLNIKAVNRISPLLPEFCAESQFNYGQSEQNHRHFQQSKLLNYKVLSSYSTSLMQ